MKMSDIFSKVRNDSPPIRAKKTTPKVWSSEDIEMPVVQQLEKDYREIKTKTELLFYIKKCKKTGYFSFDFETAPSELTKKTYAETKHRIQKEYDDIDAHVRIQKEAQSKMLGAAAIKQLEQRAKEQKKELEKEDAAAFQSFRESSFDPHRNKICTMSIAAAPHEARVLFLEHVRGDNFELTAAEVFDILDEHIFKDRAIIKIAFNMIFEAKQLLKFKKYLLKPVSDPHVMIVRVKQAAFAKEIADPKKPAYGCDLKSMTGKCLGVELPSFETVLATNSVSFFDEFEAGDPRAIEYASHDADYGLQLHLYWKAVAEQIYLGSDTSYKTYYGWLSEIDMPFTRVIAQMEYHGVLWNEEQGKEVYKIALEQAEKSKKELQAVANEVAAKLEEEDPFAADYLTTNLKDMDPGKTGKNNLVKYLIFDVLEVPPATLSDKTGNPSMDYESMLDLKFMLENNLLTLKEEKHLTKNIPESWLENPYMLSAGQKTSIEISKRVPTWHRDYALRALEAIMGIQKAGTLISSHIEGRAKYLHPITHRIHSSYTLWAETGRLTSSRPNGQNIPRPDNDPFKIRNLYQASPGKVLVLIDYSGFELRIMAWASQDATMIELFRNNGDMHRLTAATMTGKKPEQVTKEERREAKAGNFGISYGGTEHSLQTTLKKSGIRKSIEDCFLIVEAIKKTYPGIPKFQTDIAAKARACGYVETVFGYRRMLPDIRSSNRYNRGADERKAANTPIQGSAADIMKAAQNKVYEYIAENNYHNKVDMIAQVHDEIVLEIDNDPFFVHSVIKDVKSIMEAKPTPSFNVDLIAEVSISNCGWADKRNYDVEDMEFKLNNK